MHKILFFQNYVYDTYFVDIINRTISPRQSVGARGRGGVGGGGGGGGGGRGGGRGGGQRGGGCVAYSYHTIWNKCIQNIYIN